jgi:hypothetical protein
MGSELVQIRELLIVSFRLPKSFRYGRKRLYEGRKPGELKPEWRSDMKK